MKGTVATRALYYGNVASPLGGKKASDSDHTHKWTILVRGVNNEDISFWIKKVTFRLHETYPNPQRSKYESLTFYISNSTNTSCLLTAIEQPPFEVSETGWGEFEIAIKIYFHAASGEKPITLYHHLRLHPYEDDGTGQPWPKDKPVTSFNYDEIVCTIGHWEPTREPIKLTHYIFRCLMSQLKRFIKYFRKITQHLFNYLPKNQLKIRQCHFLPWWSKKSWTGWISHYAK
jgi:hypothetical protein